MEIHGFFDAELIDSPDSVGLTPTRAFDTANWCARFICVSQHFLFTRMRLTGIVYGHVVDMYLAIFELFRNAICMLPAHTMYCRIQPIYCIVRFSNSIVIVFGHVHGCGRPKGLLIEDSRVSRHIRYQSWLEACFAEVFPATVQLANGSELTYPRALTYGPPTRNCAPFSWASIRIS
jgi:hypothetical protein